jgi:hypothetical protein
MIVKEEGMLERMASMQIRRVQVGNYEVGEGTEGENEV